MTETFKPCPFCGGKPTEVRRFYDLDIFFVHCPDCNVLSDTFKTKDDAIRAWNRRVHDE